MNAHQYDKADTTLGKLRLMQDPDVAQILEWRNTPEVRKYMYSQHLISMAEHQSWWQRVRVRDDQQHLVYEWQHLPVGFVSITQICNRDANAAISSFYISPNAPFACGPRMELLTLDHAFNILRLHKVYCEVLAINYRGISLHQKFGFMVEGRFQEQHSRAGHYMDVVRLAMLASQWHSQRPYLYHTLTARTERYGKG